MRLHEGLPDGRTMMPHTWAVCVSPQQTPSLDQAKDNTALQPERLERTDQTVRTALFLSPQRLDTAVRRDLAT